MKFFGCIVFYPKDCTFQSQNKDEEVAILMRRHFITNLEWIWNVILYSIVPILVIALLAFIDAKFMGNIIFQSEIIKSFSGNLEATVVISYYFFVASYALFKFINWYYDVYVVTNERILYFDFDVWAGQSILDVPLGDIIDMSEKVVGMGPTIFGYGEVEFKTASMSTIHMDKIPYPTWFRDIFADLIKFVREQEIRLQASEEAHEAEQTKIINEAAGLMKDGQETEPIDGRIPNVQAPFKVTYTPINPAAPLVPTVPAATSSAPVNQVTPVSLGSPAAAKPTAQNPYLQTQPVTPFTNSNNWGDVANSKLKTNSSQEPVHIQAPMPVSTSATPVITPLNPEEAAHQQMRQNQEI